MKTAKRAGAGQRRETLYAAYTRTGRGQPWRYGGVVGGPEDCRGWPAYLSVRLVPWDGRSEPAGELPA